MHPPCNAVDALTSKTIFAQGESVVSTLNTNQSKASIEEGYRYSLAAVLGDRIYSIPCSFLHIVLLQYILFFKSSWCKIDSGGRN